MSLKPAAVVLRVAHGLLLIYFVACIALIYYAAWYATFNTLILIAAVSLCVEGFAVFVLNNGDCPLIHLQRRVDDNKAFFAIFMPPAAAKQAIPVFALITTVGLLSLLIRLGYR